VPPPQKPGARNGSGRTLGSPEAAEMESAKSQLATDQLTETCEALEQELEEVKVKYEMYFLGVERMEPARRRDDLKRNIARLKTAFTRNTGLRFRIQALHARYLSYERLWIRAAREKEEGTYRRDLFKARRHRREERAGAKRSEATSEDVDLSDLGPETAAVSGPPPTAPKAAPPLPAQAAQAPARPAAESHPGAPATPRRPGAKPFCAAAPPSGGLSDSQMRSLYEAYLQAKKRCNEDTSKLSYDSVAKSVTKQIPELMSRYKAKAVDFKVVIKDGKAILKAIPRT
jgi:hypothetical protein